MIKKIQKYIEKIPKILHKLGVEKNKKSGEKVEKKVEVRIITSTPKSVIELKSFFKNSENRTSFSTSPLSEKELFDKYLKYIEDNKNGNKLPKGSQTEKDLQITKDKRLELAKKAYEMGIFDKTAHNNYIFKEV